MRPGTVQEAATLLRDAKQYKQAFDVQGKAVALAPDDYDLVYDQAMLAEKAGDLDGMERLLRQIIEKRPDYQHAYNALGYSFAERGIPGIVSGFSLPEDNLHAPNESYRVVALEQGAAAARALYEELAALK